MGRVVALALSLVWTAPAVAGGLAAQKASQSVDLVSSGNCPFLAGSTALFDLKVNSDGSTTSFAIPEGQVLVITSAAIHLAGGTPNGTVQTRLFKGGVVALARQQGVLDATGRITHLYEFPTGAVVRTGAEVCANSSDPAAFVFGEVHGFLAKDK